ncbi:MAG: DUF1003 domain-containing protein [Gammaproteobacteria bacterium]|nr:DUF1003 domain-containing protein [Gammaproteobacteria bacterium]
MTDHIGQNISSIIGFYAEEDQKINRWQRMVEEVGSFIGRPVFLGYILLLVVVWVLYNVVASQYAWPVFDPVPFTWLEGLISLGALLTTIVVLIKQNRLSKMEEHRAHLDLQVNLLTEQKSTKLIQLIEELRADLPMVRNRRDPEAEALKQHADPHQVLAAMDEVLETEIRPAKRAHLKRK